MQRRITGFMPDCLRRGGKAVLRLVVASAGTWRRQTIPGHDCQQDSAIGILAVLHGMNAQSIAAFFGEAHSVITDA
jgi:hypothetical protein